MQEAPGKHETRRVVAAVVQEDERGAEWLSGLLGRMRGYDCEVVSFPSVADALSDMPGTNPDIVFTDYFLGAMTGDELLGALRGRGVTQPVIVLTASGDTRPTERALQAGASDCLDKEELSPLALRLATDNALARRDFEGQKILLQQQLNEAQKMEAIGTLASGIAHDFNNILTGVLGEVQLGLMKASGQDVEEHLHKVEYSCQRMGEIVQRLLTFGRPGKGKLVKLDLAQIVREAKLVLTHSIPRNVSLEVSSPQGPLLVEASDSALHQIILNLCINAADAMPDGGRLALSAFTLSPDYGFRLSHPSLTRPQYAVLEVHDTGGGMPPEVQQRIFEPFFTTKELAQRKGTGLGLSMVWQLVREMDGQITVYSEVGNGTTFRVYLPKHTAQEGVHTRGAAPEIPKGMETVLVVDDEVAVLDATSRILQHLNYTVLCADCGEAAIETFREMAHEIACIIMDISMPDMTGKECAEAILRTAPGVPVIFASGHNIQDWEVTLSQSGAVGFLQKPFQFRDLAMRVRAAIDQRTCAVLGANP